MENRSGSYFHQTRYGQSRPPHPHPHPPHPMSNNPSFFVHHHQSSFHPPPPQSPPPSYPQQQQQQHPFSNHQFHPRLHHSHVLSFPQSPSLLPSEFIAESRSDYRSRGFQQQQTRSYYEQRRSPIDIRHEVELESNSRFIDDRKHPERGDFLFGSNSGDFRVNDQISRSIMPFDDGDYVSQRRIENQRWLHHGREVIREDVHNPFIDRRSNEMVADFGANRVVKHHRTSRDVNVESGKGSSSSSREGNYEYNRTPRKSLQKKSALLRIQKPVIASFRIRDDDRGIHYSGSFDDSKYTFGATKDKDKDQNLNRPDRGTGDQDRQGSPVELDVSFKSNSLVAKAIITPSADVSDSNLASTGNGKLGKILGSNIDKDGLSSSPVKPKEAFAKSHNVVSVARSTSNDDKDIKLSKWQTEASGSSRTKVGPQSSKAEGSRSRSVSNKSGANVVSGKTSSSTDVAKKKIVKRLVKKVIKPNLNSSNSQPTKKCDERIITHNTVHGQPALSTPEKDVVTSVNVVDPQPCTNEITVMPENIGVEEIVGPMPSDSCTGAGSGSLCSYNINRKRSRSTSPLGFSCVEENKINENIVNDDSNNHSHAMSNTREDYSKLRNETNGSDSGGEEDASKQLCQSGESSLHENIAASRSPSSEKTKNDAGSSSSSDMILDYESDNGSMNLTKQTTVSDDGTVDVGCVQPCTYEGSPSVENGTVNQSVSTHFPEGSSQTWQSSLEKMTTWNVSRSANPSVERVGITLGSDNGQCVVGEIDLSSHGPGISKQPSPDGILFENIPVGGSLNQIVSAGGSREDYALNNEKGDVKPKRSDLELSKSGVNVHAEPVNTVMSGCWVDTTLRLSFKDSFPIECTVSSAASVDIGLQPYTDGIDVLSQKNSLDISEANVSASSTSNVCPNADLIQKHKKRKVSASELETYHPTHVIKGPIIADISASTTEDLSNPDGGLSQLDVEATVSGTDPFFSFVVPPWQNETTGSHNCSGEGYDNTLVLRAFEDDGLKPVHSCSTAEELTVQTVKSISSTGTEGEQIADATPVICDYGHNKKFIHVESNEGEKMDVDAMKEQHIVDSGTTLCQRPSEYQSLNSEESLPGVNVEVESYHNVKSSLPSASNSLPSLRDGNGVSASTASSIVMESEPATLSDMYCQEALPDQPSTSHGQPSIEKVCGDDEVLLENFANQGGSGISSVTSGSLIIENAQSYSRQMALLSQDTNGSSQPLNAMNREISGRKNHHTLVVSRTYPGRSSFAYSAAKNTISSNHMSKPRTWQRTDSSAASAPAGSKAFLNTVPTQSQLPEKVTKFQSTSYIRKGNSLVRKPVSVASESQGSHGLNSSAYRLNSSSTDEQKENALCNTRTAVADPPNSARLGASVSSERPRTLSLPSSTKVLNHPAKSLGNSLSSPLAEPLHGCATEIASNLMTSTESDDVSKSSEDTKKVSEIPTIHTGQIDNLDSYTEQNDGNVVSSNGERIKYVKRKSNQLVATSNPCSLPVKNYHNTPTPPFDGYYKRRKNQLIRTTAENFVKPIASIPDESLITKEQALHNITSSRSLTKRRKVVAKARKPSKSSFVWTLHGGQLSNDDSDSVLSKEVRSQLFPWKKAASWRSFMPSSQGSLSTISRKLLLLRKRDTIYTRSKHGFSLRKSKVLSVGGSNLKWSKSIERLSKKANEEATLAVAEADRKKREQIGASHPDPETKKRSSSSRKLVESIKEARRSFVPRRLVIGKDEYVRIGSGNQLVRDPKKRTRILASEKVRWSLHTARSRLAKKRKYCQFFTRFGKCNKDDGTCPYIHDSSKIAVCSKFLNGLCFNPDCKLTHKVIPERMPDCSFFLQGLCSNKYCPYRHVHVNPNASTCEGFLRGYCAVGNECRKKHSYVCPAYEATGSCPHGSKCKLHHPKNRSKGKKSKQLLGKKKAQGRYFSSRHVNISEPGTAVSGKHLVLYNGKSFLEGSLSDYISLDVSDEAGVNRNPADEQTPFSDIESLDLESVDIDELIKPIRIMNAR